MKLRSYLALTIVPIALICIFYLRTRPAEPTEPPKMVKPGVFRSAWGHTSNGDAVELYSLRNPRGLEVRISTYGATIVYLKAPDRGGHLANVLLGFNSIEGYTSRAYLRESPYFGAVIGRYANRINKGQFVLNGKTVSLAVNNQPNHLHGGIRGFDKVVWRAKVVEDTDKPSIELTYESKDGEEGYPGDLRVTAIYTLTDDALEIEFTATADQDTILNLTNHSYFNLKRRWRGRHLGA